MGKETDNNGPSSELKTAIGGWHSNQHAAELSAIGTAYPATSCKTLFPCAGQQTGDDFLSLQTCKL